MSISKPYPSKMSGVTLVELMLSMAISLFLGAGAITLYVRTVQSNALSLTSNRLNQETQALMGVMVNEIRRAGFSTNLADPLNNPFNNDDTEITVMTSGTDTIIGRNSTGGDCIAFTYDADFDGNYDNDEVRGYRLNNGVVEMRTSADATVATNFHHCGAGTWVAVTDSEVIDVTSLSFNMEDSICINSATVADTDGDGAVSEAEQEAYITAADCYTTAAAADETTVEKRNVRIDLTAELVSDSLVQTDMTHDVRVRNDRVVEN